MSGRRVTPPRFLVIPAAGKGTRMKPVDPHLPKELLPIGSKAAIQYTLDEGLDAGIEHFAIILSREKETIRRHLSNSALPITYLYQERPLGESDAIALAESVVGNHPLAIIYPDNLYLPAPGALKLLTEIFLQHALDVIGLSPVTLENASKISNSGQVDLIQETENLYRIKRFMPKGAGYFKPRYPQELRACGMMVAGAHIFEAIGRMRPTVQRGEFTDEPVRKLLLKENGLLGYRLPGTVFDIGNPQGYAMCVQHLNPCLS
jgi:UTP--glucose-1-phosphate uridylyltransferase